MEMLLEYVRPPETHGPRPGPAEGRQQKRREGADDRDHDQEFDQREPRLCSSISSHAGALMGSGAVDQTVLISSPKEAGSESGYRIGPAAEAVCLFAIQLARRW